MAFFSYLIRNSIQKDSMRCVREFKTFLFIIYFLFQRRYSNRKRNHFVCFVLISSWYGEHIHGICKRKSQHKAAISLQGTCKRNSSHQEASTGCVEKFPTLYSQHGTCKRNSPHHRMSKRNYQHKEASMEM